MSLGSRLLPMNTNRQNRPARMRTRTKPPTATPIMSGRLELLPPPDEFNPVEEGLCPLPPGGAPEGLGNPFTETQQKRCQNVAIGRFAIALQRMKSSVRDSFIAGSNSFTPHELWGSLKSNNVQRRRGEEKCS